MKHVLYYFPMAGLGRSGGDAEAINVVLHLLHCPNQLLASGTAVGFGLKGRGLGKVAKVGLGFEGWGGQVVKVRLGLEG